MGLDNNDEVDYKNGHTALFDGKPDNDGSDDGMGGCKGVCTFLPFICLNTKKDFSRLI